MVGILYIPYGFGDCVHGFKYEGKEISPEEYRKMLNSDYIKHKIGVDDMMTTNFRHNIARNNYEKENYKYKQQKQIFGQIKCYFDTQEFESMTIEQLLDYYENNKSFVIVVRIFNKKALEEDPDVESDLKSWQRETLKIDKIPSNRIDSATKFKSFSKKDLKISFTNKTAAILKDCKMVHVYNNTKFALWVDKIIFVNEE